MSPYRGKSLYNHGRSQLARDVAEADRIEAERKTAQDERIRQERQAERDRVRFTRDDITGATYVRLTQRRGWFAVGKVSEKSLTVWDVDLAGRPELVRVPLARVTEVQ
jgi:hypothetical protein